MRRQSGHDSQLSILALEERGKPNRPLSNIIQSDFKIHKVLDSLGQAFDLSVGQKVREKETSLTAGYESQLRTLRAQVKQLQRQEKSLQKQREQSQHTLQMQNQLLKKDQMDLLQRLAKQTELIRKQKLDMFCLQKSEKFYKDKCKLLLRNRCGSISTRDDHSSIFPTLPETVSRGRKVVARNRSEKVRFK